MALECQPVAKRLHRFTQHKLTRKACLCMPSDVLQASVMPFWICWRNLTMVSSNSSQAYPEPVWPPGKAVIEVSMGSFGVCSFWPLFLPTPPKKKATPNKRQTRISAQKETDPHFTHQKDFHGWSDSSQIQSVSAACPESTVEGLPEIEDGTKNGIDSTSLGCLWYSLVSCRVVSLLLTSLVCSLVVCLFVCLFVCLPACLPACLAACLLA